MRFLLALLALLFFTAELRADTFVYLSQAPEQTIQIFRMNDESGALTSVEKVALEAGPGSLVTDPRRKFLFASLRGSTSLASFRLDGKTGKLSLIGSAKLASGSNAAFVNTDRQGKYLFSASYQGGNVVVHGIDSQGKLSDEPLQSIATAKTAHSTMVDAENRFVFVPHVSQNAVFQFKLDAASGKLTEMPSAPGGKEKAGPRHLAFHPSGKFAFTSDESGSSITLYSLDATGLKPLQTVSTLPADFKSGNTTADVKVHPSGKFVWVSNRGHDSLAGFRFDAATGMLESIGSTPTEKTPRSFDIEPSGRLVFSGGEGSGKLAAYSVNADSGQLTRIQTYDIGKAINWVMAVKVD